MTVQLHSRPSYIKRHAPLRRGKPFTRFQLCMYAALGAALIVVLYMILVEGTR